MKKKVLCTAMAVTICLKIIDHLQNAIISRIYFSMVVLVFSSFNKCVLYCLIWSDNIFILTTPFYSYYITARCILSVCSDIISVANDFEFYNNTSFSSTKHTTEERVSLRSNFRGLIFVYCILNFDMPNMIKRQDLI